MRIATFRSLGGGQAVVGQVHGDRVVAFGPGTTVPDVLAAPDRHRAHGPAHPLVHVALLAPYRPRAVFGIALDYADHVDEVGRERPAGRWVCLKGLDCATGPSGPVLRPPGVRQLDYEAELALVVDPGGTVAGYAVADDVSARGHRRQPADGWGHWVTTADETDGPYTLRVRTWVDGELRQDCSTADMVFRGPDLIAHIGRTIALTTGDVLLTGTPAGVGMSPRPSRFLDDGSRVRIEIEALGAIEHRVVPGATPPDRSGVEQSPQEALR